MANELYTFGPFRLNSATRTLLRGDEVVPLSGRELDTLRTFVEHAGQVVSKETLLTSVWGDTHVDESNLAQQVKALRGKLGNDSDGNSYIRTVARQGYFLSVPVTVSADVEEQPVQPTGSAENAQAALTPATTVDARRRGTWYAGAAILLIVACVTYLTARSRAPLVTHVAPLTNNGAPKRGPLFCDGKRIWFQEELKGEWVVVSVARTGGDTARSEIPLKGIHLLDLASDGSALLLSSTDSNGTTLWSWPLSGNAPQMLPVSGVEAGWTADRRTVAVGEGNRLIVVDGGVTTASKEFAPGTRIYSPRWAPDGRHVSFTLLDLNNELKSLWQYDRKGQHAEPVARTTGSGENQSNGTWTKDGGFFLYEAGSKQRHDLWEVPDPKRFFSALRGKASRLTNGPLHWTWPATDATNREVFALGESVRGELVKWDRGAGLWRKYLDGLSAYELDFSKDGQWVAYVRYPDHTLWKSKLDGSERTQLTSPGLEVHQPHWSPAGQQIAFMALVPNGQWRILVLTTSSGAIDQPIPDGPDQGVPTWSADGRFVTYGDRLYTKSQSAMTIHLLDPSSHKVSTMEGSSGLWTPRWSPDGAFISALRQNSKGLLLTHSDAHDWREITQGTDLDNSIWSPDSKCIYLTGRLETQRLQVFRVAVHDGRVESLADIENFPTTTERWFGVAPDGSPIGLRGVPMQEIYAIERARP